MNDERLLLLTDYLSNDTERMLKLFDLDAEEAVAQINAEGYDFTVEELMDFAKKMDSISNNNDGELDLDTLEGIAGGSAKSWIIAKLGHAAWRAGVWVATEIVRK